VTSLAVFDAAIRAVNATDEIIDAIGYRPNGFKFCEGTFMEM